MKSQKGITLIAVLIIIVIMLLGFFLINKFLHDKAERLNAEYEAMFHTITFDTDGGNYISPKKVQTFGGISNVYAEKNGYIFEGWLLDGQLIDVNSLPPLTQDVIVKAKYRKKVDNNNTSNNNNKSSSNQSSNINNFNNNKPSNSNNNSNSQTKTENKKTYNVNIRKAGLDFMGAETCALTVMNYQTETNNSKVAKIKDGQEWVIVNMKFENKSDSTVVIDKNDFKIIDGAGKYNYSPSYYHLATELDTIEIRAGQTATFSVRFLYYPNNEMTLRFNNPSIVIDAYTEIKLR